MLSEEPVGTDDHVRVVERPDRAGLPLGDADDRNHPGAPGCRDERVDLRPGHLDGLLMQSCVPLARLAQGLDEHPVRKPGDEALGERDDLGAALAGSLDQRAGLLRRRGPVEPDGRLLHGRRSKRLRGVIAHHLLLVV